MKSILKFIFIGILGFAILPLHAQKPMELSLDSAVVYAVDHNKTLVNSRYAIDKTTQKIKETLATGLPQVSATVDYTNYLGSKMKFSLGPGTPPAVIDFNPTSNFKLGVNQLVFSASYLVGLKLTKLAKSISMQQYQKDELDVKEQTIQAYYTVLLSEKILEILNENKKNARVLYDQTENLVKVGITEQTDLEKLSVMLTSVNNAVSSAKRRIELAYNLLRLQLGLQSNQPIKLTSTIDDIFQRNILKATVIDSFNVQNNIDFKLISMQNILAKKQVSLKKSSYVPTLVAFYNYNNKIIKPDFDATPKNILGLTLNIPIFSSGQRRSQLNQAKIDYNVAKNTKALINQQLHLQQQQYLFNYKNLLEQYKDQKLNVAVSKNVLESMQRKYEQGIASSLDVTSANSDYLQAQSGYLSTMLNLLNAKLALLKINNKL